MSEESNPHASTPAQSPRLGRAPSTTATALASYYSDRKLMWRNVSWITFGHFGMALSTTILVPLMNLRLKAVGVSDSSVGLLTSANLWAVSFLVMYFSWKSDHCTSRLGTPHAIRPHFSSANHHCAGPFPVVHRKMAAHRIDDRVLLLQ